MPALHRHSLSPMSHVRGRATNTAAPVSTPGILNMINTNNTTEHNQETAPENTNSSGYIETAAMDMQCHLVIKDADTGTVILNKRG